MSRRMNLKEIAITLIIGFGGAALLLPPMTRMIMLDQSPVDTTVVVCDTLYKPNPNAMKLSKQYGISYDVAEAIHNASKRTNVPVTLAIRMARAESSLNPKATSPTGAIGLFQVLHSTARHYKPSITKKELYDPHVNSLVGLRFFRDMRKRYDGDTWRALIAYNEGPAVADTYNVSTHKYADHVLRRKNVPSR